LKSNIKSENLKNNISPEKFISFIHQILTGNYFEQNLSVYDTAFLNKGIIKKNLKIKNQADIETVKSNNIRTKVLNITENEIILEPEAKLKLKSFPHLNFQLKDIFEVLYFLNYIKKICGNKIEKCNLKFLLKNNSRYDVDKIYNEIEGKFNINNKIFKNNTFKNSNKTQNYKKIKLSPKSEKNDKKIINQNNNQIFKRNETIKPIFKRNETMKMIFKRNEILKPTFKNVTNEEIEFISLNEKFKDNLNINHLLKEEIIMDDEKFESFFKDPKISEIINNYYYYDNI